MKIAKERKIKKKGGGKKKEPAVLKRLATGSGQAGLARDGGQKDEENWSCLPVGQENRGFGLLGCNGLHLGHHRKTTTAMVSVRRNRLCEHIIISHPQIETDSVVCWKSHALDASRRGFGWS